MENPYKRKKEPLANKKLILEAAAEIGANDSWSNVTFQAIANKTGISKGGIIHHFPSKEALLDDLFDQSLLELSELITKETEDYPGIDVAYAYLKIVFSDIQDNHYLNTMNVILKGAVNNVHLCQKWKQWVTENLVTDFTETSVTSIITLLVADGMWFSDTLNIYPISLEQKQNILLQLKKF
ncbi:hypothetical protein Q765_08140 [Flavobacterium rivuli WB 3.3-2 = DSM 21788]|uniref:HTH tetR-type domain-containing protein n=1 Tax=Flavobacterium rivuli WB 3.3-2 = DSM 21788 TaxID=1121895 RepID=A0A0A2M2P9_9FLAO|nr:TetR/AcrR family transcriptional regulator [Flavobacterium rivuli]KGO86927.1 hypothetical protein Q765_08140 [Flavobacterium rivuli WB 3.3-2 = DSM 21788]